jgi:hypothetical protein
VVVAKKAAVATAVQQPHLVLLHQQRNALLRLRLPRVVLTTWMTTFRFELSLQT